MKHMLFPLLVILSTVSCVQAPTITETKQLNKTISQSDEVAYSPALSRLLMLNIQQQRQSLAHLAETQTETYADLVLECMESVNADLQIIALSQIFTNPTNESIDRLFFLINEQHFHANCDAAIIHCMQQFAHFQSPYLLHSNVKKWRRAAASVIATYLDVDDSTLQMSAVRSLRPFVAWDYHDQLIDAWVRSDNDELAEEIYQCLCVWLRMQSGKSPAAQKAAYALIDELGRDPVYWRKHLVKTQTRYVEEAKSPTLLPAVEKSVASKDEIEDVKSAAHQPVRQLQSVQKKLQQRTAYIFFGDVRFHRRERRIEFDAWVALDSGVLEYAVVPSYGKIHESLFASLTNPAELQTVFLLAGAQAGMQYKIEVQWEDADGTLRKDGIDKFIKHGSEHISADYGFIGSRFVKDEREGHEYFAASKDGVMVTLQHDPHAIIGQDLQQKHDFKVANKIPFKRGQAVEILISQVGQQ